MSGILKLRISVLVLYPLMYKFLALTCSGLVNTTHLIYLHDSILCLENGIRNLKSIRLNWQHSFEVHDQIMVSIISELHSRKIVCPNNSSKESDWWNQLRTRALVNTSFQAFAFHTKAHQHTWTVSDELSACTLNAELTQRKAGLRCNRNRVDFRRKWFRIEERSVCCIKNPYRNMCLPLRFPIQECLTLLQTFIDWDKLRLTNI